MTDLAITLPYRTAGMMASFCTCLVWILLGVCNAYLMTARLPPAVLSVRSILIEIGVLLFVFLPLVFRRFYFESSKLTANDEGLALPNSFWGLGEATAVRWDDVTAVDYHLDSRKRTFLAFEAGQGTVEVEISSLPPDGLDRLLIAMEGWLPGRRWSEAAVIRRDCWKIGVTDASHTPTWVLELRAHFAPKLNSDAAAAENIPSP